MNKAIIIMGFCLFFSCTGNHKTKDAENDSAKKDMLLQKINLNQQNKIEEHQPQNSTIKINETKGYLKQGLRLLQERGFFLVTKKDTQTYLEAAHLIEKAIAIDSSYTNAYTNLAQIYFKLDSNEKALEVLNKLLLIKPDYVEAISSQGFVLEKIGRIKEAEKKYIKAFHMYDLQLNKTYKDYINKAFLALLIYGKEEAIKELDNIKNRFSEEDITLYKNQFKNFNRREFINNSLN
jgi:tetratricopeptide (TPR) repeat protein